MSASSSFDDSLLATNESSSFTNANASLPSNLKIRSANLRLSSQISEVESRIEFGDWIFNHSEDSSAATPKAGSNAITESVCNEDDIVSSDTNGIDKESKPQYEQDVVKNYKLIKNYQEYKRNTNNLFLINTMIRRYNQEHWNPISISYH